MAEDQIVQRESNAPRPVARVLIVDDEESIRRLVSKWTDISGYEVKAAGSAEAALLMMHAWTADILICDIRMPRYSGVWLIEHLRTLYPGTAIIISTGYGEVDPALMLRAKITGYLAKPYDRETLIASLEQAMESRRTGEPPVHQIPKPKSQTPSPNSQIVIRLRIRDLEFGIWDLGFLIAALPDSPSAEASRAGLAGRRGAPRRR